MYQSTFLMIAILVVGAYARPQYDIFKKVKTSQDFGKNGHSSERNLNKPERNLNKPETTFGSFKSKRFLQTRTSGVSDADKQAIVDAHNNHRANVSPAAKNMVKMYWDDDIAKVAQAWADGCQFAHDDNGDRQSNTGLGISIGQNLAWAWSSMQTEADWVGSAVGQWHNEVNWFAFGSGSTNGEDVGHYTQLVWADSIAVGCGYRGGCQTGEHLYVCNYAYQQYNSQTSSVNVPYDKVESRSACSACPDFCDNNNLCDCGKRMCSMVSGGSSLNLETCTCDGSEVGSYTAPGSSFSGSSDPSSDSDDTSGSNSSDGNSDSSDSSSDSSEDTSAPSDSYEGLCTFSAGNAISDYYVWVGAAASEEACAELVVSNEPDANGVTYGQGHCFAEFGMTGSYYCSAYATCMLPSSEELPEPDSVCTFTRGDGLGGTEKWVGAAASDQACAQLVMDKEPTANGATFGHGYCWAEFGQTSRSYCSSYSNCELEPTEESSSNGRPNGGGRN